MNLHYDKYLTKKYPMLYKDRFKSMQETAMCWGFQCGDGWFELLHALSDAITTLAVRYGLDITVSTVKEKYGTLSFYYVSQPLDFHSELIRIDKKTQERGYNLIGTLVRHAELATYHVCEVCGNWAEIRGKGWMTVRCDSCYKKEKNG